MPYLVFITSVLEEVANGGAVVELVVAVQVLPHGDVEWRPGIQDQKRADGNSKGRRIIAAQQEAVVDVEGGPAVVCAGIELIGRKVGCPRGIGLGEIENVKAEERELALADTEVGDQLILVIDAAGLILIDIFINAVGPHAGSGGDVIGAGQKRVDVVAIQLMQTTRVDIGSWRR